jgi:hypothetical protein
MSDNGQQVDRYSVNRFVERTAETLAMRQSTFLDADRHDATPDHIKRHFRKFEPHVRDTPSMRVWNADETRVGAPKKEQAPHIIVSAANGPGPITVPQIRDHAQLTLLTAICAFGGATPPLFISKNKSFERKLLVAEQLNDPYAFTIRTAAKTFMAEVLFIGWLQTTFIPWSENLRWKTPYDDLILLLVDGHATHVTPQLIAFAGSQKIFIFQLAPHFAQVAPPCDFCVLGLFKILDKKEKNSRE